MGQVGATKKDTKPFNRVGLCPPPPEGLEDSGPGSDLSVYLYRATPEGAPALTLWCPVGPTPVPLTRCQTRRVSGNPLDHALASYPWPDEPKAFRKLAAERELRERLLWWIAPPPYRRQDGLPGYCGWAQKDRVPDEQSIETNLRLGYPHRAIVAAASCDLGGLPLEALAEKLPLLGLPRTLTESTFP